MKKTMKIVKTTTIGLVVALAVFMMIFTVISVTTFNRNDRDLFGYKAYIVKTDSMTVGKQTLEADKKGITFSSGALIFVEEVDPSTLKPGDVITFVAPDKMGETVTHKIRNKTVDANGKPGFVTYGINTNTNDETVVTYTYVMGKYATHISGLGTFFNFLKTTTGYIVCIFVPFMLLIIYQGVNFIRLFRRYKKEQNAEIEEERERLQSEREENAKMLAELQALKAQLEGRDGAIKSEEVTETSETKEPTETEKAE